MPDPFETANMLAGEAARLEAEKNNLEEELYDLRKAIWNLDLSDKYELEKALENNEILSCTRPAEIWAEINRLMGDWKPDNPCADPSIMEPEANPAEPHPDSIPKLPNRIFLKEK